MLVVLLAAVLATAARAQDAPVTAAQVSSPAPADQAATLTFVNRPIVELRAQVLSRMPADRAAAAVRTLDSLVARGVTAPVSTQSVAAATLILVAGEGVIAIVPADVDVLAGESMEAAAAAAAVRLQRALLEAGELHAPARLLRAAAETVGITGLLIALLWLLRLLERAVSRWLTRVTERRIGSRWSGQALLAAQLPRLLERGVRLLLGSGALILVYLWFAFVLRRFPYTRPWGESLRGLLLAQLASLGGLVVDTAPGLLTVVLIVIVVRWASNGVRLLFDAIERGRLSVPGVHRDTVVPMRRLAIAALWLAALATAYPYLPGSESAGFKGISVFVGVILSLGSTGVVQHLMSGLMITFARAVHVGDFARIGDVEGTILQLGALAAKVRTPIGEDVTIPNAVIVSQTLTNYSTSTGADVARLPTSVTIGYDTPWRQVEALLLTAARATAGIRGTPPPVVWRVALEDYYVKYTLLVVPDDAAQRPEVLDRLHARILDAFNEHGVQIMSPHYVSDPAAPKVVPPVRSPASLTAPGGPLCS
jgi:small-conductance mechanosensitive channel